jgi:hypothetical protein
LRMFPVTISAPAVEDQAFKQKPLEAAGNAKLIPNEELESLNAKNNQFAERSGRFCAKAEITRQEKERAVYPALVPAIEVDSGAEKLAGV